MAFKKWLALFITLIPILYVCFEFYSYYSDKKVIDPTFITQKNAQQILSKDLIANAPFKILKASGEQINSNVYSQTFYFFNQGREAVTNDLILENIYLTLSDSTAEILDYKIIKISRELTKCKISLDSTTRNKLYIDFKILEEDDGFMGQIIYCTINSPELIIKGAIKGSPKGFSDSLKNTFGLSIPPALPFSALLILIIIILYGVFAYKILKSKLEPNIIVRDRLSIILTQAKIYALAILACLMLSLIAYFMLTIFKARWAENKKVELTVPETLQ